MRDEIVINAKDFIGRQVKVAFIGTGKQIEKGKAVLQNLNLDGRSESINRLIIQKTLDENSGMLYIPPRDM